MAPEPRRKWLLIGLVLVGLLLAGISVLLIRWYERNTAHARSEFVVEFAESNRAVLYCANGYGLGILSANDHPWWEWTLLAEGEPFVLASALQSELERQGFTVDVAPPSPAEPETSLSNPNSIVLDGKTSQDLHVHAEIASEMPQNNCFPDFGDVITDADPSEYDVAAVVIFRDEGRTR